MAVPDVSGLYVEYCEDSTKERKGQRVSLVMWVPDTGESGVVFVNSNWYVIFFFFSNWYIILKKKPFAV